MKSVIHDLFPVESRSRRRSGLVSESQERILTHILPLHRLGKRSEQVYCPYCKQTTKTRVERSDSNTTKGVNAILWMGMGDPFALTAHDWCQNIDHFCTNCNGHLAYKPYRGQAQAIPEDTGLESPGRDYHERAETPTSPNHVPRLYGAQGLSVQREADKEAALRSRSSQSAGSQTLNPTQSDWEVYQPSLISHDQTSLLTEAPETEPLELFARHSQKSAGLQGNRFPHDPDLINTDKIGRNPVQVG